MTWAGMWAAASQRRRPGNARRAGAAPPGGNSAALRTHATGGTRARQGRGRCAHGGGAPALQCAGRLVHQCGRSRWGLRRALRPALPPPGAREPPRAPGDACPGRLPSRAVTHVWAPHLHPHSCRRQPRLSASTPCLLPAYTHACRPPGAKFWAGQRTVRPVAPGPDTPFPQTLAIDYVRVYTCAQRAWPAPLSSLRTAV